LPEISLGLWHNFGDVDDFRTATSMIVHAFENGITHFDLANNYGPPPGSAEVNFGKVLARELKGYRDELIISSKAGHLMWNGPYGDGGSRKYIMASIDQSLKRTGLEYFDIFYSHRYDPQTPVEETMQALIDIVRQGKALYVGISKYPPEKLVQAYEILKSQHVPCLIYQDKYSMLVRSPEAEHMAINEEYGVGFIAFSPLAQGLLTNKYLHGIPEDSRAHKSHGFLRESEVTPDVMKKVSTLNDLAMQRGQTLAEMALAWLLHNEHVTSVIVGTSSLNQLKDNLKTKENACFSDDELTLIEDILA
jgi:L-glyceraldehyde 3-phosphate reductase